MSDRRHLIPLIERLGCATVGCAGDLILDHFVYGQVSRISPEAPIPVIHIQSQRSMLGGVGNVVRNLSALGCGIRLFAVAGEDSAGQEVISLLDEVNKCTAYVRPESSRQTSVKTRYVANSQQLLRADQETTQTVSSAVFTCILSDFETFVRDCSVVFLSDYAKGLLNGSHASEFIRVAAAAGKAVIVDPKGSDFTRYRGAKLIKPNIKEIAEATGMAIHDVRAQEAACRKLLDITEAEFILLTRGQGGMLLAGRDGLIQEFPALAREVYDVSGAGDTVAAALAAALGSGAAIADAVELANIAAGIVVGKTGTAIVERAEIVHEIEMRSSALASDKALSLTEALERRAMWKRMGLRVGLVEGCFDVLSINDVTQLESLRSRCDRLVAALYSDDLASSISGTAPARDQNSRALMLGALAAVDALVVVERNVSQLIANLEPDAVCEILTATKTR